MKKIIQSIVVSAALLSQWCKEIPNQRAIPKQHTLETTKISAAQEATATLHETKEHTFESWFLELWYQSNEHNTYTEIDLPNTNSKIIVEWNSNNPILWLADTEKIVINKAPITMMHTMITQHLYDIQQWNFVIPIEQFALALFAQEQYHHLEWEKSSELWSEIISLQHPVWSDYYLLTKILWSVLPNLSKDPWFKESMDLNTINKAEYKELIEVYSNTILAVDPNFLKHCPLTKDLQENARQLFTYLQRHPWFLNALKQHLITTYKNRI